MQEIGSLVVILRDYNFKVGCEIIELTINNFYPRISTIRLPKTTITFRSQQKNQLLYYLGFFIMVKTVLIIITFKKHEKKTNVFVHPKSKHLLGNINLHWRRQLYNNQRVEDQRVNRSSVKKENNI